MENKESKEEIKVIIESLVRNDVVRFMYDHKNKKLIDSLAD